MKQQQRKLWKSYACIRFPTVIGAEKPRFSGKREKRGLYRASDGRRINADINGSYNILRKAFSDSFGQEIGGPAVAPGRLAV